MKWRFGLQVAVLLGSAAIPVAVMWPTAAGAFRAITYAGVPGSATWDDVYTTTHEWTWEKYIPNDSNDNAARIDHVFFDFLLPPLSGTGALTATLQMKENGYLGGATQSDYTTYTQYSGGNYDRRLNLVHTGLANRNYWDYLTAELRLSAPLTLNGAFQPALYGVAVVY